MNLRSSLEVHIVTHKNKCLLPVRWKYKWLKRDISANTKNKIMCIVCQFSLSSTLNLSWKLKWWDFTYNFQCAIFKNLFCKGLRHYIWIIGSEKAAAAKLWFFFCQSLLYLFFLLQVVHVGQRQHGRPPVSTLERQLAPGQSFDEAVALLQAQAIIKLNGP